MSPADWDAATTWIADRDNTNYRVFEQALGGRRVSATLAGRVLSDGEREHLLDAMVRSLSKPSMTQDE